MVAVFVWNKRPIGALVLAAWLVVGCVERRPIAPVLEPLSLAEAVDTVNENVGKAKGAFRAVGVVDGSFLSSTGRRVRFHLDGSLIYLAPSSVRFDLKKFGDRQLLFGANEEQFWVFSKEDDRYFCGRPDDPLDRPPGIPPPTQIADALGLTPIVLDHSPESDVLVTQRVETEFQQILVAERGAFGDAAGLKEFWLERAPGRRIRRVLIRDEDGVCEMEAALSNYTPCGENGVILPTVVDAKWPQIGSTLRFVISQWMAFPEIRPDGPQFATPKECLGQ